MQIRLSMQYVLRQLRALGLQPKSHYDAIRMFDAFIRDKGLRATTRYGKPLNKGVRLRNRLSYSWVVVQ